MASVLNMQMTTKANAKITGTVRHTEHLGEYAIGYLELDSDVSVTAKLEDDAAIKNGDVIHLTFDEDRAHLFDAAGQIIR